MPTEPESRTPATPPAPHAAPLAPALTMAAHRPWFLQHFRAVRLLPPRNGRTLRADLHREIAAHALPAPLAELVIRVARRTRLWPAEQLDVARELAAHFAAGVDSGKPHDDLARDFGDERTASRLIRRSKKRSRPPLWRFTAITLKTLTLLLLLLTASYAWLFVRFHTGRPTLKLNVLNELNAAVAAVPESDRAWPLYIRSIAAIGKAPEHEFAEGFKHPTSPRSPSYPQVKAWLESRPEAVPSILLAAAKPRLGAPFSTVGDQAFNDAVSAAEGRPRILVDAQLENPPAVGILLVPLGHLRRSARILISDACIGVETGDSARVVRDLLATFRLAEHAREDRLLISELVGIAIAGNTLRFITEHASTPSLFTDADLATLQSAVARYADRPVSFDLSRERLMLMDFVQRFYTDNGNGDGHPIAGDLETINRDFGLPNPPAVARWIAPARAIALPSRTEAVALIDRFVREADRDLSRPLFRLSERTSHAAYAELADTLLKPLTPLYASLTGNIEPYSGSFITRDLFEARRDAALAALAMQRSFIAHGDYPRTLDQLVPRFLDRLPVDPFTGRPMLLARTGQGSTAQVALYSVGPDAVDDRGAPAPSTPLEPGRFYTVDALDLKPDALMQWLTGRLPAGATPAGPVPKGDWILFSTAPTPTDAAGPTPN